VKKTLEHLVDSLVYNNIDTFFLVTGGAIAPIVDYIGQHPKTKYYCFQHEQSAAMAAETYFRTSGKLGVVLSTSGPGAQNLLNGICGCWYESIPCLFITGQVSTYESIDCIESNPRQLGFQEMPVVESFKPFTKFIKKLTSNNDLNQTLKQAIETCFTGRFGPSLLDIPMDIQNRPLENTSLIKFNTYNPIVDKDLENKIKNINIKIKESKRPLLLIGHGVRLSNSMDEMLMLVNKLNIPFVVSWGGFDSVPHDHPLFIGDIGVYGSRGGNFAIQNCDLLLSIGSRLDTRQTGGDLKTFSRESYKIMVDIDENEIKKGRGLNINLPVVCDAKIFINHLFGSCEPQNKKEWNQKCQDYKNIKENRTLKEDILTSYEFLEQLNNNLPEDSVIIPDEGGHLVWTMQSLKTKFKQRIFSNFGNSSMGYGLPAAIGAAIGTDKPVICIDGDGGFQMNIQELQTIKHYDLPIKIFIMNNNCYGIIKQFQDLVFNSRYIATENKDYSVPDFIKVAQAYGIKAVEANKNNFKEVINLALQEEGSILVNVIIDKEQKLLPKLEFGNPLEDMFPYLEEDTLNKNMIINKIPRKEKIKSWVTLK
jgi:acetolactate synthase-1/2/3 large subunit